MKHAPAYCSFVVGCWAFLRMRTADDRCSPGCCTVSALGPAGGVRLLHCVPLASLELHSAPLTVAGMPTHNEAATDGILAKASGSGAASELEG